MKLLMLGQDPGNPADLIVPMGRILHVPQRGTTLKDIAEMPYRVGGRSAKPKEALSFRSQQGVTLIPGLGVTEAAELQDLAYQVYDRQQQDWRERFGVESRATLGARISEHMAEKARYFKRHAVTDNGQPKHERSLF
jgi:hypothetical protein